MGKPRAKSNPERKRTYYSREFKLEAIRLLKLIGSDSIDFMG